MIARLIDWYLGRRLRAPHFPRQRGDAARTTTRSVVGTFAQGTRASLRRLSVEAVHEIEDGIAWFRRPYFWEGYALGLAALCAFGFRWRTPDARRILGTYRGMHYTGYGFWNGLALRYPLPRLCLEPQRWAGVADYGQLSPLMGGGLGFALTQSLEDLDAALGKLGPFLARDASWRHATLHGCGRALWFLFMDNPQALESVLRQRPEIQEDLAEGIGIAAAYTRMDAPEHLPAYLESFNLASGVLMRGVGACLEALAADDPRNEPHLAAMAHPKLAQARDACRLAARGVEAGPGWYAEVTRRVRDRIR